MSNLMYKSSDFFYDKLEIGELVYHNERGNLGMISKVASDGYYVLWLDNKSFTDGPYLRWHLQSLEDIIFNRDKIIDKQSFSKFIKKVAAINDPLMSDFNELRKKVTSRVEAAKRELNNIKEHIDEQQYLEIFRLLQSIEEKLAILRPTLVAFYLDYATKIMTKYGFVKAADLLTKASEDIRNYVQLVKIANAEGSSFLAIQQALLLLTKVIEVLRDRDVIVNLTKAAEILNRNNIDVEDIWRAIDRLLSAINSASSIVSDSANLVRQIVQRQKAEEIAKKEKEVVETPTEQVVQPAVVPVEKSVKQIPVK